MAGAKANQCSDDVVLRQRAINVPAIADRIALPSSFGRRFVIFADAEEEFDWTKPFARENRSTLTISGLIDATARFNASGVFPTYLVDYPVVDNAESAAVMRQLVAEDSCDIGAQLHPWVTPPFEEEVCERNSFTGNLPAALQKAKLLALTAKIIEATGVQPLSYRAGRYGLGANTAAFLCEAGYKMDVSVRSRFNYANRMGVDYRQHPLWAWWLENGLIELPLSAAWIGLLKNSPKLFNQRWLRGSLSRTNMLSRIPLTPEGIPLADALEAIATLDGEGLEIFSLSFHTPSVAIGHTPYVRCAKDLAIFWSWWDGVFNAFAKRGITPTRQGDIMAAAEASR
jgi:hypothetical protein